MTNDTLAPPPAPAPASAPAGPPPASTARVISVLMIVLGSILVAGTLVSAVLSTLDVAMRQSQTHTLPVAGVTAIDVDASRTDLDIVFADVDEASLEVVNGARGGWTFDRDGDELRVSSPDGRWFGWLLFGGGGRATLTLPDSLEGVDATVSLSAGSLDAAGSFGELDIDLAAGDLTVTGDARSLDATVSAGSADLTLADVDEAQLSLAAGELVTRLTGTPPRSTSIDVSAGSLELTLPDTAYALRSDVSAGSLDDSALRTSSTSSRTIEVQLSAGSVTLRGAD